MGTPTGYEYREPATPERIEEMRATVQRYKDQGMSERAIAHAERRLENLISQRGEGAPPSRAEEIASLTSRLMELKREEDAEKQALRDSVKPIMKYTVTPTPVKGSWDFIGDEMCVFYTIDGQCTNLDEVKAVGGQVPHSGSMRYLYNLATSRLVCTTGGGSIHLSATLEAYAQVSAFISEHPEGGDITDIVIATRSSRVI